MTWQFAVILFYSLVATEVCKAHCIQWRVPDLLRPVTLVSLVLYASDRTSRANTNCMCEQGQVLTNFFSFCCPNLSRHIYKHLLALLGAVLQSTPDRFGLSVNRLWLICISQLSLDSC